MADEDLTPEEQQALEAMETDTGEGIEETTQEEPQEPEAKEPEFKSSRTEEEQKPPEGYVPHQAMHAERMRRQELERKLEALEQRLAPQEEEKPPQYVDPLEDPDGFRRYDEWRTQQLQQQVEETRATWQQQQEQQRTVQEVQRFEAEFAAKTSDYQDAIKHLQSVRMQELASMGYSQQEAMQQMQQDAQAIFQASKQIGMNPAELAYQRAMSLGFKKTDVKPDEAQKVQALAKAQEATEGLNSTGEAQGGKLTVKALAEMSEQELAELPEAEFKNVMGG